jgi:hypothetical protein
MEKAGSTFAKIRRSAMFTIDLFDLEVCSRWFPGGGHRQKTLGGQGLTVVFRVIGHRMVVFGVWPGHR